MKKIYIVSIGDWASGGPEVLHQLGDALNQSGRRRAWMLYRPLDRPFNTPDPYRRYNVTPARIEDVEPGSIVVLPEVCASLIDRFPAAEIYFWWLSVDFFFNEAAHTPPLGVFGVRRLTNRQLDTMRRRGVHHLYQSEYARHFCERNSLEPAAHLGDYLADEYIQAADKPSGPRENIVVYNPAKGRRRTQAILRALRKSGPEVVPIQGMTRTEVRDLLGRAKVYIDFGHHPGKDRIPREAAAAGACIVTNRRGSAANSVDVPIPEEFKIDDSRRGFQPLAVERIRTLMDDFDNQAARFDDYRRSVAREPAQFLESVRAAFPLGDAE